MAANITPNSVIKPPRLENCKTFTTFKKAIELWRQVCGIPEEQQGIVVALSLPDKSKFGENLPNKAIEKIPSSKLNSAEGLDLVLAFLEKELLSDSSTELIKIWNDFFYLTKEDKETLDEFIEKFERSAEHLKDAGQILTDQVKGVELMRKLGIKSNERKSVESLVDFNLNKDNIYEAMKEQAVLFLKTEKREEIKDDKTVDNDAKKANPKKPAKQQGNQPKEAQNMMKGQPFQQGPARINNNPHFNQGHYPPGQSNPGFQASRYPNYQPQFNLNPYQQANFNQHVQGQQHGFQYPGPFQPGAYPRFAGNMGPQSNKSTNQNTGKQGGPQPGNSRPGPRNSRHPNQPGNEGGKGGANQNTGNQKGDDKNGGPSKNRKQRGKSVAPDQNNSASEGKDGDGQKSTIVVHVHNVTK